MTTYKSGAFAAIHEDATPLYELGIIDKTTMKDFDDACLTPIDDLSPDDLTGRGMTIKTVALSEYLSNDSGRLTARSQAKRVLLNLDKFHTILLDFDRVNAIGQGFADEVFRVYQNKHPDMKLIPANANAAVSAMIQRAIATGNMRQD